jgi:signal transduction histidine kinase/ActR/RegA family two-component response regulator
MKLRTQISLLLFMFGLVPLLAAYMINVPMIFDRIELLYHKAYLQNLRAGFSDLDQHIARRHEMVRLLAKMPDPAMVLGDESPPSEQALEIARAGYIDWVNQVLIDQLDITQILYLDEDGNSSMWLERDEETGRLVMRKETRQGLNPKFVEAGRHIPPGAVVTGPIIFDRKASKASSHRFMQLSLISPVVIPIISAETGEMTEKRGEVIMYLDMGGLARAYRGIYWVLSDGSYLGMMDDEQTETTAFDDFIGLEEIFSKGVLELWEDQGQQVMWVPLFYTEDSGPLWVGRSVDPSPLSTLLHKVGWRVGIIAILLLGVVFIVARLIAVKTERLGQDLTEGISRVLEYDEAVSFSWQRPQELHDLGANLTRLSEQHTEHNRALRDYAEELEASNRYKSEFLANVSHELRTPLNSILLLSKMLAENTTGKLSGEESRQAQVIHDAGTDLRALIDNILDLSRIDARQMTLLAEPVNLQKLLSDIVMLLKPQFDEKHLDLVLHIDEGVPETIVTDGEKLRQIVVNFLSNAVKFTESGGATIRLEPGDSLPVSISVSDTGIGIPAGKWGLVFEAFKQADGSTSRRYGGTGLGLTISQELARLIGGKIVVASEAGKGSTFSLLLPLEIPALPEEADAGKRFARQPDRPAERALPMADYQGARVLLVDDDVRNLLALTPLLERWGLDVMAAGDAEEALETLEDAGEFRLVIMDIMMPGMDGFEAIEKMRQRPAYRTLPVIALTARAGDQDRQQCQAAGADAVLVKPVDPQVLKNALDTFLSDNDARGNRGSAGK